jgi:hypothetical protein
VGLRTLSWNEVERVSVRRPDNCEIAAVQRCQGRLAQPLCNRDDRGIDKPEAEIVIGPDQLKASVVIFRDQVDNVEAIAGNGSEKARFGVWTKAIFDQPRSLRNDRSNDCKVSP